MKIRVKKVKRRITVEPNPLRLGARYGFLKIISRATTVFKNNSVRGNKQKFYYYKCKCFRCNSTVLIRKSHLVNSNTQSCGCTILGIKKYKQISRTLIQTLKNSANARNIKWDLDIKYLANLFEKQKGRCFYTGWKLQVKKIGVTRKTASIDRTNNKKGYIKGNVRWVHKSVNIAKHVKSHNYFIKMCKAVTKKYN